MSVVATGLVVRGAARRRQRRAEEMRRARELDLLRDLTEDTAREYEIWPPEDHDER
jgi:hypothetical protein